MYQVKILASLLFLFALVSCNTQTAPETKDQTIANGQMPNVVVDKSNTIHVVYGVGDSILYTFSTDKGATFSAPALIAELPHVYAFATRGPQVAATQNGLVVTGCTKNGDIYAYTKTGSGGWSRGIKVNDADSVAKEGLMALSADANNVYAVWLDLRGNRRNKIYGAKSVDGGNTWLANKLVYASPDSSVCECCKPSVLVNQNNVHVMFRNWLNGNRDLYLVSSANLGESFGNAQKLGNGSWPLNGCPMDGGGITLNEDNSIQTVWRRESNVYAASPGKPETLLGEGTSCSITNIGNNNFYAWSRNDTVEVLTPGNKKLALGRGFIPIIKPVDDEHIICVWENDKVLHASVVGM